MMLECCVVVAQHLRVMASRVEVTALMGVDDAMYCEAPLVALGMYWILPKPEGPCLTQGSVHAGRLAATPSTP